MSQQTERTFDVQGQRVRWIELDGDRLWRCECAAFQERSRGRVRVFRAHTAVAMMQHFWSIPRTSVNDACARPRGSAGTVRSEAES
jgi:hypothetical protein